MGLSIDEQKAVDRFRKAVAEPSMTSLVVLDFWAEWCGPCKALTPVLEKVCAEYADKGVLLAKVNVDEEGFIATQFRVQTIPTVYAIFQGQPVADLTNARSESQLKAMLDQLLAKLPVQPGGEPAQDIAPLLAMADDVLAEGDGERAAAIFSQIVEIAPDSVEAHAGLVRALTMAGLVDEARAEARVVLVDVHAAGVSFPELLQTRGQYQVKPPTPFVPGSEVGGVVREAPDDASVKAGDRVAAFCVLGGFAEVAVAPAYFTFKLPDELDFAQGASLVLNYHTAYFALKLRGRLAEGEWVLVHGAAGGVGTATIQVAKGLGAKTIAVVSSVWVIRVR